MTKYWGLYLRKQVVFVPTTGKLDEEPIYREMEPIEVAPLSNPDEVRRALLSAIARGNPSAPRYTPGNFPPPAVLKYAGVKSWSTFERGTSAWAIEQTDGAYQIVGHRRHAKKGYWEQDPQQKLKFPPGTSVEAVIDRMIAILQDAARNNTPPVIVDRPSRPAQLPPLPFSDPDWVRLPSGPERIDELADFVEWMANAKPKDEQVIRAEIKRYFHDLGDRAGAAALDSAFTALLKPDLTREARQSILNQLDVYTRTDPAENRQRKNGAAKWTE
jgi:hypothetical protein